jgi:hypothetical protein
MEQDKRGTPTTAAYVFVGSGDHATLLELSDLYERGVIRYAVRFMSGAYGALAIIEVDGEGYDAAREVRRRIQVVRDRVNPPPTDTAFAVKMGPTNPSHWKAPVMGGSADAPVHEGAEPKGMKRPVGAFVRIDVEPGSAESVLEALSDLEGYWGSAIVAGSFDILLEVAADSIQELRESLLHGLTGGEAIGGIVKMTSAITLNPETEDEVEHALLSR